MITVRIGTRNSLLALAQAKLVRNGLQKIYTDISFDIIGINSRGDRKRDNNPTAPRDKKDWIIDIEEALVRGDIDIAVHSAKDVPVEISPKTKLYPVLQRARPNDVFIPNRLIVPADKVTIETLPPNIVVGTSSLRRQAQLKKCRPDLEAVCLRGNIPTRIRKIQEERELAGIIISYTGVERLGLLGMTLQILPLDKFCPAVNQGILMTQCRKDDAQTRALLKRIEDTETNYCCSAERTFIEKVGADCHSAVAVYCERSEGKFCIAGEVYSLSENKSLYSKKIASPEESSIALGTSLAEDLVSQGAKNLLQNH